MCVCLCVCVCMHDAAVAPSSPLQLELFKAFQHIIWWPAGSYGKHMEGNRSLGHTHTLLMSVCVFVCVCVCGGGGGHSRLDARASHSMQHAACSMTSEQVPGFKPCPLHCMHACSTMAAGCSPLTSARRSSASWPTWSSECSSGAARGLHEHGRMAGVHEHGCMYTLQL